MFERWLAERYRETRDWVAANPGYYGRKGGYEPADAAAAGDFERQLTTRPDSHERR